MLYLRLNRALLSPAEMGVRAMPSEAKRFHSYTDEELTDDAPTAGDPGDMDCFYLLSKDWAYAGGGGGEAASVETFPHMLAGLGHLLGRLHDLGGGELPEEEFEKTKARLEESIARIRETGSDESVGGAWLSIDAGRSGFFTMASGYWVDFVPDALDELVGDLRTSMEESEDSDSEEDEEYEELRRQLAKLEDLVKRSDITSRGFVRTFMAACSDYDDRHC